MTKKLFLAILSVVAVFAALGTTTFAWFTLTSKANVNFDANIETGEGLLISVDGDEFKTSISLQDLINAGYVSSSTLLTAVSPSQAEGAKVLPQANPADKKVSAAEKGDFQKVDTAGTLQAAVVNVDYIEFALWFRVTGQVTAETGLAVNWVAPLTTDEPAEKLSAMSSVGTLNWLADQSIFTAKPTVTGDPGEEVASGSKITSGGWYSVSAADAARISISTDQANERYVHERPAVTPVNEAGGGTSAEAKVYGNNVLSGGGDLGAGTSASPFWGAQQYYDNRIPGKLSSLVTKAIEVLGTVSGKGNANIKTVLGTPSASLDADKLLVAKPTVETSAGSGWYQQKTIVRIWLEGWDPECFDMIYKDVLNIDLRFEYTTYTK